MVEFQGKMISLLASAKAGIPSLVMVLDFRGGNKSNCGLKKYIKHIKNVKIGVNPGLNATKG